MQKQEHMNALAALRSSLQTVIVNKSGIIDTVLACLFAGGHIILEDVPGTGKTMMARALAMSFNAEFRRVQFTPDLLPSDITGIHIFNQKNREFEFRKGPVFANILLADEINRGTPRTQSCLLQAMEESKITIDRETYPIEPPFFVIATQNPLEREGAFILPFSELDRFMIKTSMGYPSFEEEMRMLEDRKSEDPLDRLIPVMEKKDLVFFQNAVRGVRIDPSLSEYILWLVTATRSHDRLLVGASPRASLHIARFSQSLALMHGRNYCIPDDIQKAFLQCLPHRLILKDYIPLVGNSVTDILRQILDTVPVPV